MGILDLAASIACAFVWMIALGPRGLGWLRERRWRVGIPVAILAGSATGVTSAFNVVVPLQWGASAGSIGLRAVVWAGWGLLVFMVGGSVIFGKRTRERSKNVQGKVAGEKKRKD